MSDAHTVTRQFEAALCEYTGAPFAVAVNSCTMALTLAMAWHLQDRWERAIRPATQQDIAAGRLTVDGTHVAYRRPVSVEIPKRTYVSVPMAIVHAGGRPTFRDEEWIGAYQLKPLPAWDCARYFTSAMYRGSRDINFTNRVLDHSVNSVSLNVDCAGQMACVSFHSAKILGDTQGGAILHDNPEADAWLRRARFDGRTEGVAPKDDTFTQIGWHCYLSPDVAARLLLKLAVLPKHNEPLPNDDYPDLSTMEIFK